MRRATLPDFSARQLEAVLALAEYGSFVAAAARLRISQPALTRAVKRLETALGVRLFERTTRRVAEVESGMRRNLLRSLSLDALAANMQQN